MAQLATKHGIHPTMVGEWKNQVMDGLTEGIVQRSGGASG